MSVSLGFHEARILLAEAQKHSRLADMSRDAAIARDHRMVAEVLTSVAREVLSAIRDRAEELVLQGSGDKEPAGMAPSDGAGNGPD